MRATFIIIAAAFVFTANATAILKRQQDTTFESCVAALSSASSSIGTLVKDINAITKDNLLTQTGVYGTDYSQFGTAAYEVQTKCCNLPSSGTDESKTTVSNGGQRFLTEVQSLLSALQAQKAVFTSAGSSVSAPALATLTDLESTVDGISMCLVQTASQTKVGELNTQVTSVQNSFKDTNVQLTPAGPPSPTLQ